MHTHVKRLFSASPSFGCHWAVWLSDVSGPLALPGMAPRDFCQYCDAFVFSLQETCQSFVDSSKVRRMKLHTLAGHTRTLREEHLGSHMCNLLSESYSLGLAET